MKQNTIKFTIRQDGTVTEEVIGAVGQECEHLTRSVDDKLGFEYQYKNFGTVEELLLIGGIRLAKILNYLFD